MILIHQLALQILMQLVEAQYFTQLISQECIHLISIHTPDSGFRLAIDYEDLEPYELNDSNIGVSGLEGDPAYPPIRNLLPPIDQGEIFNVMGSAFNKLDWHWWPSYSAIITRSKDGRGL